MLVGAMFGKRFTRNQVLAVVLLTAGVVVSALSDAQGKGKGGGASDGKGFAAGLAILFIAQVLSAFMGLYVEETYRVYGANWKEGLFYTVCACHDRPLSRN